MGTKLEVETENAELKAKLALFDPKAVFVREEEFKTRIKALESEIDRAREANGQLNSKLIELENKVEPLESELQLLRTEVAENAAHDQEAEEQIENLRETSALQDDVIALQKAEIERLKTLGACEGDHVVLDGNRVGIAKRLLIRWVNVEYLRKYFPEDQTCLILDRTGE